MEKINALRNEVYKIAVAHGWHEKKLPDEHFLMLIVCELAEVVEADRKGRRADSVQYLEDLGAASSNKTMSCDSYRKYKSDVFALWIKDSVEDELADVFIRCLDLAGLRHIDLEEEVSDLPLLRQRIYGETMTEWAYHASQIATDSRCSTESKLSLLMFYVSTMAGAMDIDLEFHVKEKVKYNREREYKHGKRY